MSDSNKSDNATPPLSQQPAQAAQQGHAAVLAYQNQDFLNSSDGRIVRIVAEYEEPLARLRHQNIQDTVVFFGSARIHSRETARTETEIRMSRWYEDARTLAHMLTAWTMAIPGQRSRFVVTSGGGPGIMEAANRGAAEAGGKTIGFNIRLPFEQSANPYITDGLNFEFHYFFMRKLWFAYLAKALVVFPGGFGTFDEMFELITLAQTHKLAKEMILIVYGSEYWKPLINFQQLVEDGTISADDLKLFCFADTPEDAFRYLRDGLTRTCLQPGHDCADADSETEIRPILEHTPEISQTNN